MLESVLRRKAPAQIRELDEQEVAAQLIAGCACWPTFLCVCQRKGSDVEKVYFYHGREEIEGPHANADVLVIDARDYSVLIFCDQVGM